MKGKININKVPWRKEEGLYIEHMDDVEVVKTKINSSSGGYSVSFKKVKDETSEEPSVIELSSEWNLDNFISVDDFVDEISEPLKGKSNAKNRKKSESTTTKIDKPLDSSFFDMNDSDSLDSASENEDNSEIIDDNQSIFEVTERVSEEFGSQNDEERETILPQKVITNGEKNYENRMLKKNLKRKFDSSEDNDHTEKESEWKKLGLVDQLLQGLESQKFKSPTSIQSKVIPMVISGRDIVGSAETGSGKTLAFGLPILHHIATRQTSSNKKIDEGLTALIMTPTRELAMQIVDHLEKVSKFITPVVKIASIVGGMAIQKQRRILSTKPHIVVATPGRLWEIMDENKEMFTRFKMMRYLVLDEADRMLESGHFKDLDMIFDAITSTKSTNHQRQTLVFSATMTNTAGLKSQLQKSQPKDGPTIKTLLSKLKLPNTPTHISTLNSSAPLPTTLHETRIECLHTDKELYLYYLITRYTGKTIIFVNSIDAIRRLVPILSELGVSVVGLHAELEMKKRLKSLDKFKEGCQVLVTSDVAARGLDIPSVDNVIHFQVPRSADLYVHRSGRTARAKSEGVSVMLVSPTELSLYKRICKVLKKDDGVPIFPVDHNKLKLLKSRVAISKQIDKLQHTDTKQKYEENWLRKAKKDAELDDDENETEEMIEGSKKAEKLMKRRVVELREILKRELEMSKVKDAKWVVGMAGDITRRLLQTG
ncbi:ATP-dependent RNA helicase [Nowakowskiella sp. JEL0078]|nr:ATP-dependent RNA helicase [Nowakowskiella sp. JEL0078]